MYAAQRKSRVSQNTMNDESIYSVDLIFAHPFGYDSTCQLGLGLGCFDDMSWFSFLYVVFYSKMSLE